MSDEYHGQKYTEGKAFADVPARPAEWESRHPDPPATRDAPSAATLGIDLDPQRPHSPVGVYARVRFVGSYGFLCGQFQEFERYNITLDEAKQFTWSAFGACAHTVTFFDAQGNVVYKL